MVKSDEYYMKKAIQLAKKGEGRTNPNPIVGAVVVKNGKIVGRGCHMEAGLPHAEVEAIRDAGKNAKGAKLYVTLEPCSSFGRTPPCTDLIMASGIKEVIIATRDPNSLNRAKGIRILKKARLKVKVGLLEEEAKELNRVFEKFIKKKMPFVTTKIAQSLDGKIATATGESRWITSFDSRRYVHKLRSQVDAVLVGINTVSKDNPLLTNRLYKAFNKQPVKIILDSTLRISPESRIFSKDSPQRVILVTTSFSSLSRRKFFENRGVKVIVARSLPAGRQGKNKRVSLKDLMKKLAKMEIVHILVEGGSQVLGSFFKEELVDRALFFISPKIIGGAEAPTSVMGEGIKRLRLARRLKDIKIIRFKEDFLIEGNLR